MNTQDKRKTTEQTEIMGRKVCLVDQTDRNIIKRKYIAEQVQTFFEGVRDIEMFHEDIVNLLERLDTDGFSGLQVH